MKSVRLALLPLLTALGSIPATSFAAPAKTPPAATAHAPAAPTAPAAIPADQIIAMLTEGNTRFVEGRSLHPNQDSWRRTTTATDGQHPLVTILACSDSREPPEIIFDRGIGDLFIIRVAGNVVDTDITATAEYGVGHLNTPVLLVLGHTKCGAVAACVGNAKVHGSLPHLIAHIAPAEALARKKHEGARDDEIVRMTIVENVWQSIGDLLTASAELREFAKEGKVRIIGGIYDIQTGAVKFLGRHPSEQSLLAISTEEAHTEETHSAPIQTEQDHAKEKTLPKKAH